MVDQILESISHFLPETALTAALCLAILSDLLFRKNHTVTMVIVLLGFLVALAFVLRQGGITETIFSGMVVVDPFATYFKIIIGMSAILIVLFSFFSGEVKATEKRKGEYFSLLLAMTLGMYLMAGAANLLMMVLAMELTSYSSYILSGYMKEANDSSEASLKYVLYGAVSSGDRKSVV